MPLKTDMFMILLH